jgi:hypothetical protein
LALDPFFFSADDSQFKLCPSIEKRKVEGRAGLNLRIKLCDELLIDL